MWEKCGTLHCQSTLGMCCCWSRGSWSWGLRLKTKGPTTGEMALSLEREGAKWLKVHLGQGFRCFLVIEIFPISFANLLKIVHISPDRYHLPSRPRSQCVTIPTINARPSPCLTSDPITPL